MQLLIETRAALFVIVLTVDIRCTSLFISPTSSILSVASVLFGHHIISVIIILFYTVVHIARVTLRILSQTGRALSWHGAPWSLLVWSKVKSTCECGFPIHYWTYVHDTDCNDSMCILLWLCVIPYTKTFRLQRVAITMNRRAFLWP